jgi:hypothetical protein
MCRIDALVGERDRLSQRISRQQRLCHGEATGCHGGGLQQELAAIDAPVAVFVIESNTPWSISPWVNAWGTSGATVAFRCTAIAGAPPRIDQDVLLRL